MGVRGRRCDMARKLSGVWYLFWMGYVFEQRQTRIKAPTVLQKSSALPEG